MGRTQVPEIRQQWRGRARGASECRTCSHVLQLQRAPATRAPQRSNICQNPSRTLALERKRRTGTVGTSNSSNSYKLGNCAPHTNCAPQSHARPFRFVARLFDVLTKISHRGHTFGGYAVLPRVWFHLAKSRHLAPFSRKATLTRNAFGSQEEPRKHRYLFTYLSEST